MCIGEGSADTLQIEEHVFLRKAARRRLPAYEAEVRSNDDSISWVVLEPDTPSAMPRFTICRIDPCIMVMVEDCANQRRFVSVPDVESAMSVACDSVLETALALRGVHRAPEAVQ